MQKRIVTVRVGNKYGPEYVRALKNQLILSDNSDWDLYCLGDSDDNEAKVVRASGDYPGWWAKMELFSPRMAHFRPFLYVDLDTYILKSLGNVAERAGDGFYVLENWVYENKAASGVMWIGNDPVCDQIWQAWIAKPWTYWADKFNGDQDFIEVFPFKRLDTVLAGVLSWKVHALEGGPRGASIVCLHGEPKQPDTTGWAKRLWDETK